MDLNQTEKNRQSANSIGNSFGLIQSHKNLLKIPKKEQRRARLSLNVKDFQEIMEDRSAANIKTQNQIQRIHEEMETKIFRLSLQLQGCQSELKESREESARLNRLKEQRQDMFCEQNMRWAQKQAKYFNEIVDVNDRMQELKKHTSVRTSELERETQLRDRKIQHLESKIREYEIQRDLKVIQIEGRYRQKIGYLQRDHIELMRKHEEQLRQMKAIYKIDDEEKGQMNVSNGKHRIDNEIYTQLKQNIRILQSTKQQNQTLVMKNNELKKECMECREQISLLQGNVSAMMQNTGRKMKESEEQIEIIWKEKMISKQALIQQLKVKIQKLEGYNKIELQSKISRDSEYEDNIQQMEREYTEQICKLKESIIKLNDQINTIKQQLKESDKKIRVQRQKQQEANIKLSEKQKQNRRLQNVLKERQGQMRQIGRVNRQSVQELKGQILKLQNELGRQQMCNNNNTNSYMNIIKIEKEGWEHKVQQLTMQINEKVELQRQIEQIKMEIEKQARQRQELQAIYNQEKQQLCMEISRLNTRNEYMEEENAKLNKSINQLTQSINQNCLQFNNYMQTDNHNHKEKVQKLLHRIKQVEMDKYRVQEVVEEQKREILRMQEQRHKVLVLSDAERQESRRQIREMKLMNEQLRHRQQEYDKEIKVLKHKYEFEHAYESKLEEENMRLWKEEKHKLCAHVEQLKQQINQCNKTHGCLKQTIGLLQNERKTTSISMKGLMTQYQTNIQKYQNYIKMIKSKYKSCVSANESLTHNLQQTNKQYQQLHHNNQIVQHNYQKDFGLWHSKFITCQNIILSHQQ